MCSVEQPKLELLDDINYLHLMQIVWSYSEMSDLKEFAVELPFSQFAQSLIVFERLLIGDDSDDERCPSRDNASVLPRTMPLSLPRQRRCNIKEARSHLAGSYIDFINAVESSEAPLPNLKDEFLKGIGYLFVNFNPIQPNEAYFADDPSEN